MSSGTWVQTISGIQVDLLNPRPGHIKITDIAHALGMKCRFNGHLPEFYSVGEHCVHVSYEVVKDCPYDTNLALWGLLHDAAEAYMPDIASPIKHHPLGVLSIIEDVLTYAIRTEFNLQPAIPPPEVHRADKAMLATEAKWFKIARGNWDLPIEAAQRVIKCYSPTEAKYAFLSRFYQLVHSNPTKEGI